MVQFHLGRGSLLGRTLYFLPNRHKCRVTSVMCVNVLLQSILLLPAALNAVFCVARRIRIGTNRHVSFINSFDYNYTTNLLEKYFPKYKSICL